MQDMVKADAMAVDAATAQLTRVREEIGKIIVGQRDVIDGVLICLLAGGHVLLEGVPGLGKTTLLRTLGRVLHLKYSRIQFTPDLMPGDIVGSMIMETDERGHRVLRFQPGPVFANLVLADEINRATPKTQSALLEAMQERTITSGTSTYSLDAPFLVMATQNPIEMEGTYPLPEAQLDRFLLKVLVPFPSNEVLARIGEQTTGPSLVTPSRLLEPAELLEAMAFARHVVVAPHVTEYAVRMISFTHPDRSPVPEVKRFVRFGSSPRGLQALLLSAKVLALRAGRWNVALEDLDRLALPALRHRLILHFEATAEGTTSDQLVSKIVERARAAEDAERTRGWTRSNL